MQMRSMRRRLIRYLLRRSCHGRSHGSARCRRKALQIWRPFPSSRSPAENHLSWSISIQHRSDGATLKDTYVNIRDTGEFVANLVTLPLAEGMHKTAFEHPPEVDE